MKEYQRDLIGEKASKIKKTLKTKDRNGNVIKTIHDVAVGMGEGFDLRDLAVDRKSVV